MKFQLIKNAPATRRYGGKASDAALFHSFEGTTAEFCRWAETLPKFQRFADTDTSHWAGFFKESPAAAIKARTSVDALAAVEQNTATLHAPLKAPAKPILSPVGASFSIGRVLQGHPVCAFRRPRTALPPKTINIALSVSAFVDQAAIAASIAKIASAAWQYHLAGGAITVKMHYIFFYSKPADDGAKGIIISINVPIADMSSVATGASIQFFRGFAIPVGKALSGEYDDGLPVGDCTMPGVFTLSGKSETDQPILDALRIG